MITLLTFRSCDPYSGLQWWEWGKIIGFWSMVILVGLWFAGYTAPALVWAIALHIFIDFACQTDATAEGKADGDFRVLAYHSFLSGGYPGFMAGGLAGLAISVVIHLLVDATKKFGLPHPSGAVADQTAHIATIIALWWYLG